MYAQFPKDLNLLALGYLPVKDVLPMKKNASWDSLASQSLDQRMQEIIQKWKASESDPSQRLETLREIFIVNPILSTLDEERQNRVLSSIEVTSEEILTIFSEIYPWVHRPSYDQNPHYYQFRFTDKAMQRIMPKMVDGVLDNPKISMVRILAWKTFLRDRSSLSINLTANFLHLPAFPGQMDTSWDPNEIEWLSRGAQIANLPLLQMEGQKLSRSSIKTLRKRIKSVQFKDIKVIGYLPFAIAIAFCLCIALRAIMFIDHPNKFWEDPGTWLTDFSLVVGFSHGVNLAIKKIINWRESKNFVPRG